jgi:hypothetical protein
MKRPKPNKTMVEEFNGQVPARVEELLSIPNIGMYTACAVACFKFGDRVPIVDTNVLRVLSRITGASFGKIPGVIEMCGPLLGLKLEKMSYGASWFELCRKRLIWTYGREAATGPHLSLQSANKIEFGDCRPVLHAFSVITNIWQPSCHSFSDKQLELMV